MRHLRRAADLIGQTAFGAISSDAHNPSDWPDVPDQFPKEGDIDQGAWYESYDIHAPGDAGDRWREKDNISSGVKNPSIYIALKCKHGNVYLQVNSNTRNEDPMYGPLLKAELYGSSLKDVGISNGDEVVLRMVRDKDIELSRSMGDTLIKEIGAEKLKAEKLKEEHENAAARFERLKKTMNWKSQEARADHDLLSQHVRQLKNKLESTNDYVQSMEEDLEVLKGVIAGGWLICEGSPKTVLKEKKWNFAELVTYGGTKQLREHWTHVTMDDRTLRRTMHFIKVNDKRSQRQSVNKQMQANLRRDRRYRPY